MIKALVTHILCSSDGTAVGPSVCIDACDNDHSKRTETTVTIFGTYDDLKAPLFGLKGQKDKGQGQGAGQWMDVGYYF